MGGGLKTWDGVDLKIVVGVVAVDGEGRLMQLGDLKSVVAIWGWGADFGDHYF